MVHRALELSKEHLALFHPREGPGQNPDAWRALDALDTLVLHLAGTAEVHHSSSLTSLASVLGAGGSSVLDDFVTDHCVGCQMRRESPVCLTCYMRKLDTLMDGGAGV